MTVVSVTIVSSTCTWASCGTLPSFEVSQVAFSEHVNLILVTGKSDLFELTISTPKSKSTSKYVGSEIQKENRNS